MGGAERRRSSVRPINGTLPDLEWSSKMYTPAEFPSCFNKPQIVRILPGDSEGWEGSFPVPGKTVDLGPDLDTTRPFLIYSHRRRTKVFAEHVAWDPSKKAFKPNGPLLEIPKDYIGWLEVISKDGLTQGHHISIQSVVGTGCKYFLTKTTLNGFKVSEDEENGLQILGERKIYPGEVVKVDKVFAKKWKLVDGTLRGLVKPETQFLKCTDLKKNVVCVSMAHPGIFNPVAQKGLEKEEKVVYLINDITKVFKFPIYVRLAFGWPPKIVGTNFSGVLKLTEIEKRETLVVYNFLGGRETTIAEIPTDLNIRLQIIDNLADVEETEPFKAAMEECVNSVYPYVVSMKAMEIPYKPNSGPPPKKRPIAYGRMAMPCDMRYFSRSDIYPPLEEQQMSTLSRLSFKDPERALKGLYHMDIASIEETTTDASVLGGEGGHSRTSSNASSQLSERFNSQLSTQENEGAEQYPTSETLEREMRDSRAQKMKEILKREAPC